MHEKMKKIGESFRMKREEMNLSLKEVENATSIRMMYIQALEEGTVDKFLSPIYAQGFFKQYAGFLGFDSDKLIKENIDLFRGATQKHEFDYGIGTLESRSSQSAKGSFFPNIMWIGICVTVLFIAWYFAKFLGIF